MFPFKVRQSIFYIFCHPLHFPILSSSPVSLHPLSLALSLSLSLPLSFSLSLSLFLSYPCVSMALSYAIGISKSTVADRCIEIARRCPHTDTNTHTHAHTHRDPAQRVSDWTWACGNYSIVIRYACVLVSRSTLQMHSSMSLQPES